MLSQWLMLYLGLMLSHGLMYLGEWRYLRDSCYLRDWCCLRDWCYHRDWYYHRIDDISGIDVISGLIQPQRCYLRLDIISLVLVLILSVVYKFPAFGIWKKYKFSKCKILLLTSLTKVVGMLLEHTINLQPLPYERLRTDLGRIIWALICVRDRISVESTADLPQFAGDDHGYWKWNRLKTD